MFEVLPTSCPFLATHDVPYILAHADEEIARLSAQVQIQQQAADQIRNGSLKEWVKADRLNAITGARAGFEAQITEIRRVVQQLKEGVAAKAAAAGALLAQQVLQATRQS